MILQISALGKTMLCDSLGKRHCKPSALRSIQPWSIQQKIN